MTTTLILDATYLCHRAFHAFPTLQTEGASTGVLYGFFRDLVAFTEWHNTDRFIFCFDHGINLRKKAFAGYKSKRDVMKQHNDPARDNLHVQMDLLRKEYLPAIGYKNILFSKGYEADDMIASLLTPPPRFTSAIIVSSDKDMYQLLSERVWVWNPASKKAYTAASLKKQYGVDPVQWPHVKSIAGCSSDNIPGVDGVGEITAAKFLTGKLSSKLKTYQAIELFAGSEDRKRNYALVKLPYPGTPSVTLTEDDVTEDKWRSLMKKLGMKSLTRTAPLLMENVKQGFLFD